MATTTQAPTHQPHRPRREIFQELPAELQFGAILFLITLVLMIGAGWMDYGCSPEWRDSIRRPSSTKQWAQRMTTQWNLVNWPTFALGSTRPAPEQHQRRGHLLATLSAATFAASITWHYRRRQINPLVGRTLRIGNTPTAEANHGH